MSSSGALNETAVLRRVIHPDLADLSPDAAKAILKLDFEPSDRRRMRQLAGKARAGSLTARDREQIAIYERVGSFLSLYKAKARRILKTP
jgi:hypothetical protein